ncbi:MAG: 2-keto-4-pentenoate hydratase [Microbacteriaceae bacterium]|nr:2-keto-4-pentenoate hydratase [Microbacteriaceae bacterium]
MSQYTPGAIHRGVLAAAARLSQANYSHTTCAPVRDLLSDLPSAYEVQELGVTARVNAGARRVGRKVGLTSIAVQQQLGVDQPDFGVLLDDMDDSSSGGVDIGGLLAPRIEAEVAFILSRDIMASDRNSVIDAVEWVVPALEIVDSRIKDWDISILDTVADNASCGRFVLGDARRPLDDVDTIAVTMSMTRNGEVVSAGDGSACLGDPLNALGWVARTALDLGRPLRAGEVVLSGALGPMVPFEKGDVVEATIVGLGRVTAHSSLAETNRSKRTS